MVGFRGGCRIVLGQRDRVWVGAMPLLTAFYRAYSGVQPIVHSICACLQLSVAPNARISIAKLVVGAGLHNLHSPRRFKLLPPLSLHRHSSSAPRDAELGHMWSWMSLGDTEPPKFILRSSCESCSQNSQARMFRSRCYILSTANPILSLSTA